MEVFSLMFIIITNLLLFFSELCVAADNMTSSQSITPGRTLVSREGRFELGFFSPGSSEKLYLGIWYKNIPDNTVVWVANRCNPVNSSGMLMINSTGNLVLAENKIAVWSPRSMKEARGPVLQLLDSGNLVLRDGKDGNSGVYLWQSFDYPSDTYLPGMKLGWDLRTGLNRQLSAWRSSDDPCPGGFTWEIELYNNTAAVIWKGSKKYFQSGPWNGLRFSGAPELRPNPVFEFSFISNEEEVYYTSQLKNRAMISRIVLNQTVYSRQRYMWSEATQTWQLYAQVPRDYCDNYALCGVYGNCVISASPICQCLKGFKPKSNTLDWSEGCVRIKPLNCQDKTGFVKIVGLKLPDPTHSWVNKSMNLKECERKCMSNCSCTAYTQSDIRGKGSGCAIWFGDLIDIRQFPVGGQDLYIRMPASELEARGSHTVMIVVISITTFAVVLGLLIAGYQRIIASKGKNENNVEGDLENEEREEEDLELPLFDLASLIIATDNFSSDKKLGEGGFGPVYKGRLEGGQEIAVKRLSVSSGQGLNEFKNEVILIAKLQHRNLVKLLGCCIQGEEKMLIYEYMPNKSLDFFILDKRRGKSLDWSKRFHIIDGIARGLLYLHQDSRLRIIHRDLKASNVLLDNDLNAKISDFGLARSFRGNQTEGNTNRVVGTYGYMAPEYAIYGLFSVKSDVFSFGILLMEIVSGKKNRGFYQQDHSTYLIEYAWRLYVEGRPLELIDDCLGSDSSNLSEVLRCIHISLLCVQQHPEDRPSMSSVVVMLGSQSALPQPKQPGFLMDKNLAEADSASGKLGSSSTNDITVSLLEAR